MRGDAAAARDRAFDLSARSPVDAGRQRRRWAASGDRPVRSPPCSQANQRIHRSGEHPRCPPARDRLAGGGGHPRPPATAQAERPQPALNVRSATGDRRHQPPVTPHPDSLMANLSARGRDRLEGAFAADPELASGLCMMLADLPADTQETATRGCLEDAPLGGGALIPALADVIEAAMERPDTEPR